MKNVKILTGRFPNPDRNLKITMAVPTDADRKRRVLIANFHERNRGRKKKVFDFGSSANQTTVLGSLIVAPLGRTNPHLSRLTGQCGRSLVLVITEEGG